MTVPVRSRSFSYLSSHSWLGTTRLAHATASFAATEGGGWERSRDQLPNLAPTTPGTLPRCRTFTNATNSSITLNGSGSLRQRPALLSKTTASRSARSAPNSTSSSGTSNPPPHLAASVRSSIHDPLPGHRVATVTVSNPSKLNIVNSHLLSELQQTFRALSQDPDLRAVILTGGDVTPGKAPAFIGGADITEMAKLSSSEDARSFILKIHDVCTAIRDCPVPVIARIHGFCLGAGLEIAASCDLRIATELSVFGMPEVKVGIPSVVEAALLPSMIGMGRTRRFLYLAENISAHEAERWGLVEKVVADDTKALNDVVNDWTQRLVDMGPKAIRLQKTLMRKWENASVDDGILAGVDAYAKAFEDGGKEPKEFMGKFVNRRRHS